jgi:hypothetical protein
MRRFAHVFLVGALIPILIAASATQTKPAGALSALAASATYAVNNTADSSDADQSDGVCADALGRCTLRAAIMQANFVTGPNTITVPSGVYVLTRAGQDDLATVGDLDIIDDLTILGAGSASTIVDGNGGVTGDRVFEIVSSTKTTVLNGLTLRNGQQTQAGFGGGLLVHGHGLGSLLQMHDVVIENNTALYGGGLAADYTLNAGSMLLDNVVVRNNVADEEGGGIAGFVSADLNFVTIRNSQIYSNAASHNGGGIRISGDLGEGIKSAGDWLVANSQVYSNTSEVGGGAGIATPGISVIPATTSAFQLTVRDSRLYDNHARLGGAIINGDTLVVSRSTLDGNTASDEGGGIYNVRSGTKANQLTIVQSTLARNTALSGGSLSLNTFETPTVTTLINSTLSDNAAAEYGGAVYARGDGTRLQAFNTTITGNHVVVPFHAGHGGIGAGVYITLSAVISAQNTLLAYNATRVGLNLPLSDDCIGPLHSLGFNLIQTPDNCNVITLTTSDILGRDPLLGPLAYNGGSTQTRALLPGSPAIDTGQRPCMDASGAALATD